MTWKLWLAASVFGGVAILMAAAVIKGARTKSPFKKTPTDHDKARNLARRTLERIHP